MWRENRLVLAVIDTCPAPLAKVVFPTSFGFWPFI
jgi:hypothetical protein